jgi:ABC-type antimicrobial peptide transport system permease subunit
MYFSALQVPTTRLALVVRASVTPESLNNSIRRELSALDPELPLYDVVTLETVAERSVGQRRFSTDLLALFAAVALLLSAVGIYGLVSYSVTQRTRELGIRMALGADARSVVGLVLGQSSRLALSGVAIGLGAGLFLTRLMASLLYGVGTLDPLTMIGVPLIMAAVASLASALPAWRATRVDPMIALRSE